MNKTNTIYVIFWVIVSFLSSFMGVMDGDFSFITDEGYKKLLGPVLVWIFAFFGDYLYNIYTMNEDKQYIDKKWTKVSYISVEVIFCLLFMCMYITCNIWKISALLFFYASMAALKLASLSVIRPRVRIKSLVP